MVSTADNSLLDKWLNNKKDDLTPYYYNKLEFLKLYGNRCRTQTKPDDCSTATTEDECIGGRELYCQYSNKQCVDVIDSICNYYDDSGNYIKEKWAEDQVEYLDRLYKTGGLFEYGKVIYNDDKTKIDQTIKTNAFQIIYNKFNVGSEPGFNKAGCFSSINKLMKNNKSIMDQIHDMRENIFKKLKIPYDRKDNANNNVKLIEISIYLYEVLYNMNDPTSRNNLSIFDRSNNFFIFKHDKQFDKVVIDELGNEGICVQSTNPKQHAKPIPSNLFSLKPDDFNYKIPTHSVLFNVLQWSFNLAKNSVFYFGNLVLNTGTFLINNYGNISIVIFLFILVHQILGILVDADSINIFKYFLKDMDFGIHIAQLKKIMPYLNVLYTHCRNLLCILIPVLNNVHFIHTSIGSILGNELARMYFTKSILPAKLLEFIPKLTNIAFVEVLINLLKNDFLQCGKYVRAMGKNRDIVYVDDKESDFQIWKQFIIEQWNHGTTQPAFKEFKDDLLRAPMQNINKLWLVLNSIITCEYCKERVVGQEVLYHNIIAKDAVDLFKALFIEGPFYQVTAAKDIAAMGNKYIAPLQDIFNTNPSDYAITKRISEIITLDVLFFLSLFAGIEVGYMNNDARSAYKKGIEYAQSRNSKSRNSKSRNQQSRKRGGKQNNKTVKRKN